MTDVLSSETQLNGGKLLKFCPHLSFSKSFMFYINVPFLNQFSFLYFNHSLRFYVPFTSKTTLKNILVCAMFQESEIFYVLYLTLGKMREVKCKRQLGKYLRERQTFGFLEDIPREYNFYI